MNKLILSALASFSMLAAAAVMPGCVGGGHDESSDAAESSSVIQQAIVIESDSMQSTDGRTLALAVDPASTDYDLILHTTLVGPLATGGESGDVDVSYDVHVDLLSGARTELGYSGTFTPSGGVSRPIDLVELGAATAGSQYFDGEGLVLDFDWTTCLVVVDLEMSVDPSFVALAAADDRCKKEEREYKAAWWKFYLAAAATGAAGISGIGTPEACLALGAVAALAIDLETARGNMRDCCKEARKNPPPPARCKGW